MAKFGSPNRMVCCCALALLCALQLASSFVVSPPSARAVSLSARASALRSAARSRRATTLRMSEEEAAQAVEEAVEAVEGTAAEASTSVRSFFAPNKNVRLGSSRDQDGKSNVWAVEPKMKVEGEDVETTEGNGLAITGAIVGVLVVAMAATIFSLPGADTL